MVFLATTMSDDFETPPAEQPSAKPARKRPAPRKTAKAKPSMGDESAPAAEAALESVREAVPQSVPFESRDAAPEPIPFFVETTPAEAPGNSKKRRRRKKKHGQGQSQQQPPMVAPPADQAPVGHDAPPPVMHAAPRPKLDAEEVTRKAWRIFRSEVGEEGLALIDDQDAREISRRCFRLAEIFLEEAARRNR
jgi:hypothetical protein